MARIAIIDDNAAARAFARAALRHLGHELQEIEPTCLFEVLRTLHDSPPDLLLTDLVMPTCPGQTLIQACREDGHLKHIPIILLTAHSDVKLANFLQSLDHIQYITKPVGSTVLAASVDRVLKGQSVEETPQPPLSSELKGVVAVVDDSRLTRVFLATSLRKQGFDPVEIEPHSLASVMDALREAKPRLLVVDYHMPHFQGDALIRALREDADPALKGIPVLMVTAHASPELSGLIKPLGSVEILLKPVQADALRDCIEAMLAISV